MIPQETIEEIRSRCDIVEVVGSYLPQLKRRGSTFKCNCPFHQEKTPSFTVNEARQIYHCFGCGAGGDVFRFVMEYEKVDFVTAVKMLGGRVGVEIVFEGGAPEEGAQKDVLYRLHADAAAFYHRLLLAAPEGEAARRYLAGRELPDEVVKAFQIGFAPDGWDGLIAHARKKGYTIEQIEAAGLAVASERNSHYDRFRNRLMFPICDQMGRVIGFSGRVMDAEAKAAKYVNSPETPLFHKNRVLFAFDKARKPIVEARRAIVVEGQIDAIRCHQAGLRNVVASQGTALTENHARLIKRYADEVVLVLDADAAGVKAALGSSEIFVAAELSVRVATLPEGEDPDSLIRKSGAETFSELVGQAVPALDFLVDCLGKREGMESEAGRMRVVRAALELIAKCPSAARRDTLLARAAELLGVSPQALAQDLRRLRRGQRPPRREGGEAGADTVEHKTYPRQETALLELLVHHYAEVYPLIHDYLPSGCLTDSTCRKLLDLLMVDPPDALAESFPDFDEETQRVASRVLAEESRRIDEETPPATLAAMYIVLFWKRRVDRELAGLARRKDLSAEARYIEQARLAHVKKVLENGEWEAARVAIEAYLDAPAEG